MMIAVLCAAMGCTGGESKRASTTGSPALAASNPVADENALPGSSGWQLSQAANFGEMEGYASDASVNHGEVIEVHARANDTHLANWELYRMGYYGGLGGRLVASGGFTAGQQDTPAADPRTGLVECAWPVSFTIATQPTWVSGIYLVKLIRDDGPQSYLPVIVRADERKGVAVLQASVTTWQAYNDFGGESLYSDSIGLSGAHAKEVSFNRPYTTARGAGDYFYYEHYLVQWAESRGYDLTYLTNIDLDRDASLLANQRLLILSGHDEYWSRRERAAVEGAIASGVNFASLAADEVYWQVRLEPSRFDGRPGRTEVCYKEQAPAEDPQGSGSLATVRWREAPVSQPEQSFLGVMSDGLEFADLPWIVAGAGSWVYAGTGLRDGDTIPLLVGYESDKVFGAPAPGVQVLARSPIIDFDVPSVSEHNATLYTAPSGAFAFAAGVVQWAFGLSLPGVADARVQRMTDNLFQRAGLSPATAGDSFGAGAPPAADTTGAASAVITLAGAPGAEGLVDGPGAQARFRRPIGVAADSDGTLFVTDAGNHAVRRIDPQGNVTTLTTALDFPAGIAIGGDGALYVADLKLNQVFRVGRDGAVSSFAGQPGGGLQDGGGSGAAFNEPSGIVAVGNDFYVADAYNSAIRRIDAGGSVTTVLKGAPLYRPTGLTAFDGGLYVVDSNNRVIARVGFDGSYSVVAGVTAAGGYADGPAAAALFMPLFGIVQSNGTLLITDTGNERLRAISPAGAVTTFAGSGAARLQDGAGPSAAFNLPTGIAALPDGSFAVVDDGDSTVRVVRR